MTPYYYALRNAATYKHSGYNNDGYALLGSCGNTSNSVKCAWGVSELGNVSNALNGVDVYYSFAPAFNIDPSKVNIMGGVITRKAS